MSSLEWLSRREKRGVRDAPFARMARRRILKRRNATDRWMEKLSLGTPMYPGLVGARSRESSMRGRESGSFPCGNRDRGAEPLREADLCVVYKKRIVELHMIPPNLDTYYRIAVEHAAYTRQDRYLHRRRF